ncbi:MAG: hypothetical protein IAG13_37545, partial [Deltaproteobacteria bacterium]|nr:hypothetical protein [Nannocystaceae bacterium]
MAMGLALLTAGGCRGEDISFDCDNQSMKFNAQALDEVEPLRSEVPSTGPFPVAVQISGAGLNELLANIVDDDVPFAGTVPFALTEQGPADASFAPTTTPEIRLQPTPGCDSCVVFHLEFGVALATPTEP